jgi:hypothetical protein
MISVIETASFTHAFSVVTNGRLEAASEREVKDAKQIILYALAFFALFPKAQRQDPHA